MSAKVVHIRAPAKGPGGRPRADDDWRRRTQPKKHHARGTVAVLASTSSDRPPLPEKPPARARLTKYGREKYQEIRKYMADMSSAPGVRPWLSIDDIGRVIGVCKMYQWAMEMETTAKIGSGAGFVKDVREAKIAADAFEKYQKAFDKLIYTDGFNRRIVPDEDPDSADFGD